MNLLESFLKWRNRRNHYKHLEWLRRNRVLLLKPHHSASRPGTECVP